MKPGSIDISVRFVVAFVIFAWAAVAPLGCAKKQAGVTQRVTEVEYRKGSPLNIKTKGSVLVIAMPGTSVRVEATFFASSDKRYQATAIKTRYEDDGSLTIKPRWPEGGRLSGESCDLRIEVPGANGVTVLTKSGSVLVQGLSGRADLTTTKGQISVKTHMGSVFVKTTSGRVDIAGVKGAVEAQSETGTIVIRNVTGSVVAKTDERIEVSVADQSTGPVELSSKIGPIELETGVRFKGSMSVQTGEGNLTLPNAGPRVTKQGLSATLKYRSGGGASTINTEKGDITVRVRGG